MHDWFNISRECISAISCMCREHTSHRIKRAQFYSIHYRKLKQNSKISSHHLSSHSFSAQSCVLVLLYLHTRTWIYDIRRTCAPHFKPKIRQTLAISLSLSHSFCLSSSHPFSILNANSVCVQINSHRISGLVRSRIVWIIRLLDFARFKLTAN